MATTVEPKAVNLWDLLERRYEASQGYLTFFEVANGTGYKGTGYADAMVLSTWPSQGIKLMGFEIKRSRSDLIKELRDEAKSAQFAKFCDHWWLVVSDSKLTDGVEVPANWGILAPRNGVLYQVRAAPKLEHEPWTPTFIAALMRRFHENHVKKDKDEAKRLVEERAAELAKKRIDEHSTRFNTEDANWKHQYGSLKRAVSDFEAKSGITVQSWNAGNVGDVVRLILDNTNDQHIRRMLENVRDSAERISKSMRGALKNLDQLAGAKGKSSK